MKILINGGAAKLITCLRHTRPDLHRFIGFMNTPKIKPAVASLRRQGCQQIALDNAAYSDFCEHKYQIMIEKWLKVDTPAVHWITVPDEVGNAKATLNLFHDWQPRLPKQFPLAFVGQDGAEDTEIPFDDFSAFFIGGTTHWKLSQTAADLAREEKRQGKVLHMGRVNSQKRLRYAYSLNCDSVDGTGYSKFCNNELVKALEYLKTLHQQPSLF